MFDKFDNNLQHTFLNANNPVSSIFELDKVLILKPAKTSRNNT